MRARKLLPGFSILSVLLCAAASFAQTPSPVPLISQVTPPSLSPAPTPTQIVQFSLTISGANFPSNAVVKLTLPEGPSIYAASASVNATGTQIVAQFNTTLPRPAVYTVTVANGVNNPTRVSNVFYLPVTPAATTVGIGQTLNGFVAGMPSAMAIGDFNGDGYPDIAVVSQNSNTVSILLGAPGGIFNPGASYPSGNLPSGIVARSAYSWATATALSVSEPPSAIPEFIRHTWLRPISTLTERLILPSSMFVGPGRELAFRRPGWAHLAP